MAVLLGLLSTRVDPVAAFGCFTEQTVWDVGRRDITALPVG
ncbi:hypothetical protein [Streptomyces chrestomyceticus]|nr:hypothetical protein [Streptomyces chrestomyceticus]